ncbi:MAG: 23S rRNA (pseudouridine(1915)-N(3))-methyltransferase RlmH [Pseudomonadota bacterium]
MKIHLIAIGNKMPAWVATAYGEYAKRLPRECSLHLVEIPAAHRGKSSSTEKIKQQECKHIQGAIPKGATVVALDEHGKAWSTRQLSAQLANWLQQGPDIALLVGGADGLSAECLQQARLKWSLSPLTLPHPMVRVLLAEQLYRAWSLLQGHPYHRG